MNNSDINSLPIITTDCYGSESKEKASLVYSKVLNLCPSRPLDYINGSSGITVRVPVILSLMEIDMNIRALIELDEKASSILSTKNNVFLSQCKVFPKPEKVFISGYIRKAIEYAPWAPPESDRSVQVRQGVFHIPFKCAANISFITPPDIKSFDNNFDNTIITQHLNEKIICELVLAKISEDIDLNLFNKESKSKGIKNIEDRISLRLTIRLIQNQNLKINI